MHKIVVNSVISNTRQYKAHDKTIFVHEVSFSGEGVPVQKANHHSNRDTSLFEPGKSFDVDIVEKTGNYPEWKIKKADTYKPQQRPQQQAKQTEEQTDRRIAASVALKEAVSLINGGKVNIGEMKPTVAVTGMAELFYQFIISK